MLKKDNIMLDLFAIMLIFVICMARSCQVKLFIKFLLKLGRQGELCFILHRTNPDYKANLYNERVFPQVMN